MVEKLTVVLFILVCLMVGTLLILLPWTNLGIPGDWIDNYFLQFIVEKTGSDVFEKIVASGWFRGAITGLGVFNLFLAFWEVAYFSENVAKLESD